MHGPPHGVHCVARSHGHWMLRLLRAGVLRCRSGRRRQKQRGRDSLGRLVSAAAIAGIAFFSAFLCLVITNAIGFEIICCILKSLAAGGCWREQFWKFLLDASAVSFVCLRFSLFGIGIRSVLLYVLYLDLCIYAGFCLPIQFSTAFLTNFTIALSWLILFQLLFIAVNFFIYNLGFVYFYFLETVSVYISSHSQFLPFNIPECRHTNLYWVAHTFTPCHHFVLSFESLVSS
jgi:hypothetical protein